MATFGQWLDGARPRTWPASVSPVLVGWGAAAGLHAAVWWKALLALLVALALQIGVNYANDYSDGVRGTDTFRLGPPRLVGSGAARPAVVRAAAWACSGVAAVAGLALVLTSTWWLALFGVAAIAAAWLYTGGPLPYGYRGLGEVAVFLFFGPGAVLGTLYVQSARVSWPAVLGSVGVGALACAILVANNLRDIPGDTRAGKRTLAVLLGARASRWLYVVLLGVAWLAAVGIGVARPWALLALVSVLLAVRPVRMVAGGARGYELIPVLRDTGLVELCYAISLGVGLVLAG